MITGYVIYRLATRGQGDRASRYVVQLDTARIDGTWHEVPELIKKVKKHVPQCKALIEVAAAEAHIASIESRNTNDVSSSDATLNTVRESLQTHVEGDEEVALQGSTCLLWANWTGIIEEPDPLPRETLKRNLEFLKGKEVSTWTKICMVKGAYIEGMRSKEARHNAAAWNLFTSAVDLIQANDDLVSTTPQFAYWSEQLLAQMAVGTPEDESLSAQAMNALRRQLFRNWVHVVSLSTEPSTSVQPKNESHLSRVVLWRKYYEFLSLMLSEMSNHQDQATSDEKWQLATEIRKVEGLYESDLLRIHKFPKATESNAAIEDWVEQVIGNWRILCGPQWRDAELGEGGRNSVGHGVLDILYRAATKTFHSTLILRRLFQLHKSLTEFDLAYGCLDTYIELVERAKSRATKSTAPVDGLESTETYLLTLSEATEGLCQFGGQAEAQKAHKLCMKIKGWLRDFEAHSSANGQANGTTARTRVEPLSSSFITSDAREVIYRALGVGTAHWSRWTPFSEQRTQLQEEAVDFLTKACSVKPSKAVPVETQYAAALVLAETREIEEAISYVKKALNTTALSLTEGPTWAAERKAVSLWHLLALLLTSRHEFESASKSCHAAFQQLPSNTVLFGGKSSTGITEKRSALINDMECSELERMVEIRITELALTELKDGPEAAVNSCNEMLAVFSQFFAHLDLDASDSNLPAAKTPAGTIKSTKGSIFGKKKNRLSALSVISKSQETASIADTGRPSTQATQAPSIQITDESGKTGHPKRHKLRNSLEKRLDGKITGDGHKKLIRKSSQRSTRTIPQDAVAETPVAINHNASREAKQPLPEVAHNLDSHNSIPPPASHDEQPPRQDVRLPTVHPLTSATSPAPRFSKSAAQCHALALLVKLWLVIATLYRRASMYEYAREACEEAAKAISKLENIISAVDHSARAFSQHGWGGTGKSVDQLWADVYFERAELLLSIYQRRRLEGQDTPVDDLRDAIERYEQCLMFFPDHCGGIIALSNLLLDYYEDKIDLGGVVTDRKPFESEDTPANTTGVTTPAVNEVLSDRQGSDGIPGSFEISAPLTDGAARSAQAGAEPSGSQVNDGQIQVTNTLQKVPESLTRIAARDRAYGLLSALTKLGSGWDSSEAWSALARAHELSGEVEKAKSVLWWCIELEDTKPIRHWRNLGYVLD